LKAVGTVELPCQSWADHGKSIADDAAAFTQWRFTGDWMALSISPPSRPASAASATGGWPPMKGLAVRRKARSTLRHHADRYEKKGIVGSLADFSARFGWEVERMIVDIRATLGNPCHYCAIQVVALAECSLDITDPRQPPHYRSNTRWICRWCNREKARSDITRWEDKLSDWGRWRQRHSELLSGMPLFDWADSHQNLTLFDE
jgi:hypothetical protein